MQLKNLSAIATVIPPLGGLSLQLQVISLTFILGVVGMGGHSLGLQVVSGQRRLQVDVLLLLELFASALLHDHNILDQ